MAQGQCSGMRRIQAPEQFTSRAGTPMNAQAAGDAELVVFHDTAEDGRPAHEVVGARSAQASYAPLAANRPEGMWFAPAPSMTSRMASSTLA